MSKSPAPSLIRLRGVRQNNLKNFDLDLPTGRLIVVTGLSGSGKSSLAFDTLYAEGQRRYIETFSPYARQFFERMDKPQVDSIRGIPPAIAIEQRNAVKSTRSTVGTMTEICEYMKVVWSHSARLFCRQCGQSVRKDTPQAIWDALRARGNGSAPAQEFIVAFDLPLSDKLSLAESLGLIAKQGYQRVLVTGVEANSPPEILRLEEALARLKASKSVQCLTVVQDRVRLGQGNRARFVDACEQAYHFGKGKLALYPSESGACERFSNRLHCARCDLEYRDPTASLFSFNHPVGACPTCRGFGRTITIDYNLALPDRSLTLAQGVVKPWQTGQSAECQQDLMRFCRKRHVPVDVPLEKMSQEWQTWLVEGDPGYGKDPQHEWPHAWYGIKGYFRWLESKAYKMHVRVLLSRYRSYKTCLECGGRRFQPEALLYKMRLENGQLITLADFYQLSVDQALGFVRGIGEQHQAKADPLRLVLEEVCARLGYLDEVGLGYLTLDRPTRSLSGGETERVNLTTCLGSRLVNTLFVLDEPSVGLHPRDTQRLIRILERLRDTGNTVVVVEHEASVMRAADQIVDLGPGHGEAGGSLVFQGSYQEILDARESVTGRYLSGALQVDGAQRRTIKDSLDQSDPASPKPSPKLTVWHASCHNLNNLTVQIPLERFVCITGVSGSGKTTLIREVLLPVLHSKCQVPQASSSEADQEAQDGAEPARAHCPPSQALRIDGCDNLGRVVLVDQSALGKTPRSNPAVYIGAFDHIRDLFAQSEVARQRGLSASAFSFNSAQGQCELCRGAGFEKIEMQFLSDIYIRCAACNGRRYRQHILEVKIAAPPAVVLPQSEGTVRNGRTVIQPPSWSIADVLEATVDESIVYLSRFEGSRPAVRAIERLKLLEEVGLGYLRLGQPINSLSGGESQRLKLVSHLAEFTAADAQEQKPTLFLFDEPTTGLHFADVRVLVGVFQRLVDQRHSVVVVEHNLDLIRCADWVVDLGPEGGEGGGQVVVAGPPEDVAACEVSHTGLSLRQSGVQPTPRRRTSKRRACR